MEITITAGSVEELRKVFQDFLALPEPKLAVGVKEALEHAVVTETKKEKKTANQKVVEEMKASTPPETPISNTTYDIALAAIKRVKMSNDPDIGVKVKNWLNANKIEKLAAATNEQRDQMLTDLGITL
jgi:hypothetical protein